MSSLQAAIDAVRMPREHVRFRDGADLSDWLAAQCPGNHEIIGASRSGQPLYGVTLGHGPRAVSIIAGSHADEPIGPLTAQMLPVVLPAHFPELLERYTFHIVPQMNPDGADNNRLWFANPPDFVQYVRFAVRELPGDDIEFGFGEGENIRPECAAARDWLAARGPFAAHFSLHGMGFAEGAWFLLCREWVGRAGPVMDGIAEFVRRMQFPFHDVERHGEKGFTRIAPGFCTTPRSDAMRAYFLERDDPAMAAKFLPSSMEFVQSLGGDPLCMVSEMPLFGLGVKSASLEDTTNARFRADLDALRAQGPPSDDALLNLAARYELGPVFIPLQIRAQLAMIVIALAHA